MDENKPMNGEVQDMGKGELTDKPLTPEEIAKLVNENGRA